MKRFYYCTVICVLTYSKVLYSSKLALVCQLILHSSVPTTTLYETGDFFNLKFKPIFSHLF